MKSSINKSALRAELAQTVKNWQPDEKPKNSEDIFFPSAHLRALALDRPLVIGMRGSGKSFWSDVLANDQLRKQVARHIDAYESVSVVSIRWDEVGSFSSALPDSTSITYALERGLKPQHLWLCVILQHLRASCASLEINIELPDPNLQSWNDVLVWGGKNVDVLRRVFNQIEIELNRTGKTILIVIDALDRMSAQLSQSIDYLRGLLELLLESRQLKGLRFKVFLRPDMASMPSVLAFPDASKLLTSAVHLLWNREEIYALHLHRLAQKSFDLQNLIREVSGQPEIDGTGFWHPSLLMPTEQNLRPLFETIISPYMGLSVKKGLTYRWWFKHLADGQGQVSPRTFAAALKASLELPTTLKGIDRPYVIAYTDVKQGIRSASMTRVAELGEDYFWVKEALKAFQGKPVPASVSQIYGYWNGSRNDVPFPQFLKEECQKKRVFLPWSDDQLQRPSEKLRDTLISLGVLVLRNNNTRLDIPDIYRVGYGFSKHGGVSLR